MVKNKNGELKGPKDRQKPPRLTLFSRKSMEESLRRPQGNALALEVTRALERAGIKAEVSSLGEGGFRIRAKGGDVFLADSFTEDDSGLSVPGSTIGMDSLKLQWFRKALAEALGCKDDDALYEKLASGENVSFSRSPIYRISIAPVRIFRESVQKELVEAKNTINSANPFKFAAYLDSLFSSALKGNFAILNPGTAICAKNGRGLRSMVEEDKGFRDAVKEAQKTAEDFIDEVRKDLPGVRKKISAIHLQY